MKTVPGVSASKAIEAQSIPLRPDVLVLGGGIVGITIAQSLARLGIHVTLVEKGKHLGGNALDLHRFYSRDEDVQRWIEEKISDIRQTPQVAVLTEAELKSVSGHVGRFQARIECPDGVGHLCSPSAIVVATGYTTQSEKKGIYSHKRIIRPAAMEKLIAETTGPVLQWEGKTVTTITFLLDGTDEDIKIDFINALKQTLILQETYPCQVVILCKEVKVSADGVERLYRRAREKGVLFLRYETPPRLSIVDGHIQVDVNDTAAVRKEEQWPVSILSSLLVVSEAFVPAQETERICGLLKLHRGPRGFLMEDNPQLLRVRTNRRGIFLAGGCRFPQDLSESVIEAKAAAQEVIAFLAKGTYTIDPSVAEVDPKKCAVCYTCPRLCPHSAITIEEYAEENIYTLSGEEGKIAWGAAKVDPAACFGCGICVAECPAKAITLRHETDDPTRQKLETRNSKFEAS